jgi:hypothetical protein
MLSANLEPLRVFSQKELLHLLGISRAMLVRMSDPPPRTRLGPKRYGYRADHLKAWLDARDEASLSDNIGRLINGKAA